MKKYSGIKRPDKVVIVDKKKLCSIRRGVMQVGSWVFDKRLVFMHGDTSSEIPVSETLIVISKKDKAIWLRPEEVASLKALLEELTEQSFQAIAKECEVVA